MKTLKQVLDETGIGYRTYCYYRQLGILPAKARREMLPRRGSVVYYPDAVVHRIKAIFRLKDEGKSLGEIADLLRHDEAASTGNKPCPFCGGEPSVVVTGDHFYEIRCPSCGAYGPQARRSEASAWNGWNCRT